MTPIQNIGEQSGNMLFVKREDLLPFSFGGNKARKAELFFQDIEKQGSDCVVTYGSSSSNHCRIIANMASAKGIACYIIMPNEASEPTNNSSLINLFGAKVILTSVSKVKDTIHETLIFLKREGFRPFFIQGGGHGNNGTQAYVDCYQEIKTQEDSLGIQFDYIFHASGTGTTQAGLICGKVIHRDTKRIVGISVARKNPHGSQVILDSIKEFLKPKLFETVSTTDIEFVDDYILDGYGAYNYAILQTVKDTLLSKGIALDTTYTGKAFWGMLEFIKKTGVTEKNILFIHTGSAPLFFDDLGEFVNGNG